jgi:predicted membrane protein
MALTEPQQADGAPPGDGLLYGTAARLFSLLLAIGLSGLILVMPTLVAGDAGHGKLTLLMWGIAAGFVHGVGYVPVYRIWRWLFGPLVGWVLMLGMGGMLLIAT